MVFSSIRFLFFFLPVLLFVYYISPKKLRNSVLFLFSLLFYYMGEKNYVILLLFSCFVNYIVGLGMEKYKKKALLIGLTFNLGILFYYKYTNFFLETFSNLFSLSTPILSIGLPLGISFFTLQNISYLVDVYLKKVECQKNFFQYATYITLFPQLIAGPIIRYNDIYSSLENREESMYLFGKGARRFVIGLAKKILLADAFYNLYTSILGSTMTMMSYLFVAIGFTLQIYYDFSGYSDMAIGLGNLFGFHFKENFDYPLVASSVTEFFRKWHISLSSFLKEYIYIPLGGSKKGTLKTIRNLGIVWILTGLWHGASWNFVLWGLYFFVLLTLEKFVFKKYLKKGFCSSIFTFCFVVISFVIFSLTDINEIFIFLKGMFGIGVPFVNQESIYYLKNNFVLLLMAFIGISPYVKNKIEILKKGKLKKGIIIGEGIGFILLFLLVIATIISSSFQPFLYFRF